MMAMANRVDRELMFVQLLVARFIIGICIGLSSSPSAVYSAEIAHPSLRGRISVLTSLTIGLGVLLIYTLGYFIPVGSFVIFKDFTSIDCIVFWVGKLAASKWNKLWNMHCSVDTINSNT